jgi:hypothetical protein
MGLEAACLCRWPDGSGEVKALLESRELILRGALRRRIEFATMSAVRADGECLWFEAEGAAVALDLGAARAALWARKILSPPSLASKLGIGPAAPVFVIGAVADPALAAALDGAAAETPAAARFSLAVIADEADLVAALGRHEAALPDRPIWLVYGKGKQAVFGEAAVRRFMRAAGYIDAKVSAVSDTLSATRYARRG